ncbi:MAG: hypothetical protein NTX53_21175 [candidate division WOR-3 bacterium]|nr:hypothetical protein [candidate division WOR-3 bacterium]
MPPAKIVEMHNSFQGGVLKGYQAWVTSGFREPAACDAARDYLTHLRTPDPKAKALWPH